MNERIKELFDQSFVEVKFNIDTATVSQYPDPNGAHTRMDFSAEKFAELIVQECAEFIAPLGDWCGGHGEPRAPSTKECAAKLKQHFGVE